MLSVANRSWASGRTGRRQGTSSGSKVRRIFSERTDPHDNGISTENGHRLRDTGLEAVGEVPWGTHFSIFYETKKDLLEIVVPFFKAGLQANEFCLWVVASSELLTVNEAKAVLHEAVPDFDRLLKNGNIEIVPYDKWFLTGRAVDIHKSVGSAKRLTRQRTADLAARG